MINKEDFYLKDVELCKQLEPIMRKKGIEADAWFAHKEFTKKYPMMPEKYITETYRKDSLEAALPEWCWDTDSEQRLDMLSKISIEGMRRFLNTDPSRRGQESLKALGELIVLLDTELDAPLGAKEGI